jgi:hypothetical protein
MKVIDHLTDAWTLFRQGQELFLDTHCQRGGFGFSVLIRLDAQETYAYRTDGHAFVEQLARDIAASIATAGAASPYQARDVAPLYSDRVASALEAWHAAPPRSDSPEADALFGDPDGAAPL